MKTYSIVKNIALLLVTSTAVVSLLTGCGGTEGQRLMQEGASPAYAQGFDDGCSSGKKAAGDMFSQFHKNVQEFQHNSDYRQGWNDGHEECRSEGISNMQQQELVIEEERAIDEHKRTEQLNNRDMIQDAMPDLNQQQIDNLNRLGH